MAKVRVPRKGGLRRNADGTTSRVRDHQTTVETAGAVANVAVTDVSQMDPFEQQFEPRWSDDAGPSVPGDGDGRSETQMVAHGDMLHHPLPEGNFPEGDPRNDAGYATYVDEVNRKIGTALSEGRSTEHIFGVRDSNGKLVEDDRGEIIFSAEREREHQRIIDDIMVTQKDVPSERKAVLMGGLPGAGKSTFVSQRGDIVGIESVHGVPVNAVVVNPDDMKTLLLERKNDDGTDFVPRVDGLTDGEHAALVHEESAKLSRDLSDRAIAEGKNVIFDITLGKASSSLQKYISPAKQENYQISGVFIDGDITTSLHRAGLRHKQVPRDGSSTARQMTGRYVPYDIINQGAPAPGSVASDGKPALSKNRLEYDSLVKSGIMEKAVRVDNRTGELHQDA